MNLFGRIGSRLLRWFLLVALIPLIFMGYQGYYFAKRAVEREVFLHMQAVAESKRRAIEQWFRERQDDLAVLATNPQLVRSVRAYVCDHENSRLDEITQVLAAYQGQSASYAYLCLHDQNGEPLACTMGGSPFQMADMQHSTLFEAVRNSKTPVLSPVYLQKGLGPGMHVASMIHDTAGQPLAVLVATLALANTLNPIILDTTGLGRTGQAYLVDTAKVMLTPSRFMHHPDPLTHKMDFAGPRAALAGEPGPSVYEGFGGQKVMGAWEYMPEQRWALIAEMDADEAFAPLAMLRRNAIIVALLTLGAILIVVAWVSRSISLPIRRLADASLAVSQGDLDRRVAVKLKDEVGELSERFNRMVTSLRDSQRQVVQSERLAAIGELVASVVHEIRNPLSAIKMNLRILEHKCDTSPVIAEHFELANRQMERLEAMLKELLDYSKPVPLNKKLISVRELVAGALRHLELEAAKIDQRLDNPERTVNVDAEKMERVLMNLFLNAKQAMPDGGTITISSGDQASDVMLSVSDTGHGISKDNLKHIFEPFFTTRKQGTGLGLSNAKKIVEAHGGLITVKSEEQKGTEVVVALPRG
jgi:signal transduction histidine kinase